MDPVIRIHGRRFDFTVPLGYGRPRVADGGAKYEEEARPQDDAMTVFQGNALVKLEVPVLLDGWGPPGKRHDIGPRIDRIVALCFGEDGNDPPDFVATGPFQFSGTRFQMELPEETEEPASITGPGGTQFRQALILKLVEFNDPDTLKPRRAPRGGRGKGAVGGAVALVAEVLHNDETLLKVSARVYGTPNRAKEIGDLNGIRDVRAKLRAGRKLQLPK